MKVKLIRSKFTNNIEATVNGEEINLFEGCMETCAEDLSNNELRTIYDQANKQYQAINPEDRPLIFEKMMRELQQVMINRKAYAPTQTNHKDSMEE